MTKIEEVWAKHPGFNSGVHFFGGLGIAWLVSLAWHYSIVALVLGIVFSAASIAGRVYAQSKW